MRGVGPSRRDMVSVLSSATLTSAGVAHAGQATIPGRLLGGVLPAGVHRIERDTAVTQDLVMAPGAQFDISTGVTLRLLGDLIAPGSQIFTGAGRVDLCHSRVTVARPEWWGAVPDDAQIDSLPAFRACVAAHPAMQLGLGDYFLSQTWAVDRPNRRVWGVGRTTGARGSRLVLMGGVGPVVRIGAERQPATINDFLRGIDMRWLELGRTTASAPPVADGEDSAGLEIRYVLDCNFEGLRAHEHAIGYSIRGAVRTYLRDCTAFRSVAADPERRDIFVGFDMDGRSPPFPTGANASLYLIDCNARTGNRPSLAISAGCRIRGALSDTALVRFETTEMVTGILIEGGAGQMSPAQRRAGHVNLKIDSPVLDQCLQLGISISSLSDQALVDIESPYVALALGGQAAISISRSGGNITLTGGQLIGWVAGAESDDAVGFALRETDGVEVHGLKLLSFPRPIEVVASSGFELAVAINHPGRPTGRPAVRVEGCRMGYLRPRVAGAAGAFAAGVEIHEATGPVTVETTGLDPRVVAGGALVTVVGQGVVAREPGAAVHVSPGSL